MRVTRSGRRVGRTPVAGDIRAVRTDWSGNGVDDGRETQANIYQALFNFNAMDSYPGIFDSSTVLMWDNWIASDELWEATVSHTRCFSIRDKPAEEVVRTAYGLAAKR